MKTSIKVILLIAISFIAITLAIMIGSVQIPVRDILDVLAYQWFDLPLSEDIPRTTVAILWNIRFPRSVIAFIVGAGLAVSGTVMQSVLRNPLASSYTLGVSAGASLGAATFIVLGITLPVFGNFTLAFVGFITGLATVFLIMSFSMRLDKNMENHTIILVGMVFSLFVNGILTMITALHSSYLEQLVFWQMGSFSGRSWDQVLVVGIVTIFGIFFLMRYTRDMDMMTFGEDQAMSVGIDLKKVKFLLIGVAALLTGTAVAFVGIIGFVDLIAPHVVRRIFGSSHQLVVPMSALFGGTFMVLADLLGRTMMAPSELPVGAVTALIGAPFFAYIYFKRKGRV